MKCVIRGKLCPYIDMDKYLDTLEAALVADLSLPTLPLSVIVTALDRLGKKLLNDSEFIIKQLLEIGMSGGEAIEAKKAAASILEEKRLYLKLKRELSRTSFEITRVSVREPYLEGFMPLGVLGHVTSSNDGFLPFLSAVEGLLTGNINIIKTATGANGVAAELAAALCEIEPKLEPYIYVFPISSKETKRLKTLFLNCDAVAVWGGENAVNGVSTLTPSGVPVIAWGHRISFAYVTKRGKSTLALEAIPSG